MFMVYFTLLWKISKMSKDLKAAKTKQIKYKLSEMIQGKDK